MGKLSSLMTKAVKFQLLQNYQKRKEGTPYYYVFDILSYKGKNVTELTLLERKKILRILLAGKKDFEYSL